MDSQREIKKSIQIRHLRESDADAVAQLNISCWKKNYRGLLPNDFLDKLSLTPKRILHFQNNIHHTQIALGAFHKGTLLGYLCGGNPQNKDLFCLFELHYLYVHPDFQGLGIGSMLFHAFQEITAHQDFHFYVLDGNQKALSFYQKMGCIRQPKYDTDKIVMGLKIHELCLFFSG